MSHGFLIGLLHYPRPVKLPWLLRFRSLGWAVIASAGLALFVLGIVFAIQGLANGLVFIVVGPVIVLAARLRDGT
jgi:hypothetical protein